MPRCDPPIAHFSPTPGIVFTADVQPTRADAPDNRHGPAADMALGARHDAVFPKLTLKSGEEFLQNRMS